MRSSVNLLSLSLPSPNHKEILRYSGGGDEKTVALIEGCLKECENLLSPSLCWRTFEVNIKDNLCDFGEFSVKSDDLSKNLKDCKRAVVFCATIGAEFDRLLIKYSRLSPTKALIFQGIGAERIEALCDAFCENLKAEGNCIRPRFSAGYGDLPLDANKDIFLALCPEEAVGVVLSEGMLMTPTKSVTAFIGLLGE